MKYWFRITEVNGYGGLENYIMAATVKELKTYLRSKRVDNGYIQGVGGNKRYEIFAVQIDG